jgi:hypothetical protein
LKFRKTSSVAKLLGVQYWILFDLIRGNKIPSPAKDESGDFVWLEKDLNRAKLILDERQSKRAARAERKLKQAAHA